MKYLLIEMVEGNGLHCEGVSSSAHDAAYEALEWWVRFKTVPYVLAFDLDTEGKRIEVARDGTDDLIEEIKRFCGDHMDRLEGVEGHPWLGDWPREQMDEIEREAEGWERHIKAEGVRGA